VSVRDLLNWWNLIYMLPLVVSVFWIVVTVVGGMQDGSGDGGDVSLDDMAGGTGDGGVDLDLSGDLDSGEGADADADLSGDTAFSKLLNLVGASDVSLTMFVGILMLSWGVFGMLTNRFLGIIGRPSILIVISMGVTLVLSFAVTRLMAEVVGRLTPKDESFGVHRSQLVGLLGHTVYTTTEKSGTINVKDQYGTVHRVQARLQEGDESLPPGTEVVVIDYDEEGNRFLVRKYDP
jgi:membrane protein implicated in regulation of membrane protease activity